MAEVIALPRPTRTDGDQELDLAPCDHEWRDGDPGLWHRCWTWRGWPHICRCTRCEVGGRG